MYKFINAVESGLLADLSGLYTCDLSRELHTAFHVDCLACAKMSIVEAIVSYRQLDGLLRVTDGMAVSATTAEMSIEQNALEILCKEQL